MNTYTMQDWHNDRDFKAQPGQKVEASIYWDMLCGVPPIYSLYDELNMRETVERETYQDELKRYVREEL